MSSSLINSNKNPAKKIFESQIPIQEPIIWSIYNIIFDQIGDKTFISIILLYFQTKTSYLILTSILAKTIFIYIKFLINEFSLFQVIYPEVFQVIGLMIYYMIGLYILFKLMFGNNIASESNIKSKKKEDEDFYFYFEDFFRIFGIVFFTQISSFSIMQSFIRFTNADLRIANINQTVSSLNYLAINFASIIFAVIISNLIGFICFKKFSIEFNLIISAITFLLMGIDDTVKFFSVFNEWKIL
jgi:hypothetical protein